VNRVKGLFFEGFRAAGVALAPDAATVRLTVLTD